MIKVFGHCSKRIIPGLGFVVNNLTIVIVSPGCGTPSKRPFHVWLLTTWGDSGPFIINPYPEMFRPFWGSDSLYFSRYHLRGWPTTTRSTSFLSAAVFSASCAACCNSSLSTRKRLSWTIGRNIGWVHHDTTNETKRNETNKHFKEKTEITVAIVVGYILTVKKNTYHIKPLS